MSDLFFFIRCFYYCYSEKGICSRLEIYKFEFDVNFENKNW